MTAGAKARDLMPSCNLKVGNIQAQGISAPPKGVAGGWKSLRDLSGRQEGQPIFEPPDLGS